MKIIASFFFSKIVWLIRCEQKLACVLGYFKIHIVTVFVLKICCNFEVLFFSTQLQSYLEAVVTRLKKTLDDDVFMPIYPLR